MINMKPHCLAVQSVLGEQCGELIWRAECVLNSMLPRDPGRTASHACVAYECPVGSRIELWTWVRQTKTPFSARGRGWKKHHLKSVWFGTVRLCPESNQIW